VDTAKLIESMFAARNKFLSAAAALDAAISALDGAAPVALITAEIPADTATGALFPTPHGDPA